MRATKPENKTQKANVQANSINSLPKNPSIKPIGRNTDAKVCLSVQTQTGRYGRIYCLCHSEFSGFS